MGHGNSLGHKKHLFKNSSDACCAIYQRFWHNCLFDILSLNGVMMAKILPGEFASNLTQNAKCCLHHYAAFLSDVGWQFKMGLM